jgi:subtilisin family serine protease
MTLAERTSGLLERRSVVGWEVIPMRWSCFALLAVVACTSRPSHVHVGAHQSRGLAKVSSGLVAVEWRPGTTHKQIDAEDLKLGVKAEFEAPDSESDELTVVHTDGLSDESLKQLQADPLVQDVEPVYEYESLFVPNDPDFVRQWHMSQIGVESAWDWGTGSDVVVAVIDTGVATLSDLPSSELVPGYDFVNKRATAPLLVA